MTDPGGQTRSEGGQQAGQDAGQQQGQNNGQGAGSGGQQQGQNQEQQGGQQQGSGQDQGQLYTQDYVSTLRGEAANYRTQRNQYRDALRSMGMLDDEGNLREAQNRQGARQSQQNQQGQQQEPSPTEAQLRAENERLQGEIRRDRTERRASELVVSLGGKPERASYIARLANLDDLRYDEAGRPDEVQLQERITTVLNDLPELRAGSGSVGGSGSNPAGGAGGNDPEHNPFSKEHFNLTKQMEIWRTDPQKAERLQKAAAS